MLLEGTLELKKLDTDAKVTITEAKDLNSFKEGEEKVIKAQVDAIVAAGANVVFCEKGIGVAAQNYLARTRNPGSSPGQERGYEDAGPGYGRETGGRCDAGHCPRIWDRQPSWKSARSAKISI